MNKSEKEALGIYEPELTEESPYTKKEFRYNFDEEEERLGVDSD